MYRDIKLLVNSEYHNKRVDFFLKEKLPDTSRQNIRRAFLSRTILINGKEARKGEILSEGDTVLIKILGSKKDVKYWPNLIYGPKIVYQDDFVAALYKPPFMHTLPAHYGEKDTLANFAAFMFPGDIDKEFRSPPLFLSRLDYETSGVILMARNIDFYQTLKTMQDEGEVLKAYALIVTGEVEREFIVTRKIVTTGKGKVAVDRKDDFEDEMYHTKFVPEKVYGGYSLLRGEIKKGRMHQIRAHASFAGFPIVGDIKYGGREVPLMKELPVRPLLHSACVEFSHAVDKVKLRVNCPYPEDLYRVLNYLQECSDKSK